MKNVSECPVCCTSVGVPHLHGCDFAAEFPSWLPEHGLTRSGYPVPNFSSASSNQVRHWGKKALDLLAVLIKREDTPEDTDWLLDARRWTNLVLTEVTENLGTEDAELRAYEAKKLEEVHRLG